MVASGGGGCFFFFFNDTATTEIYTLSLHDALPIFVAGGFLGRQVRGRIGDDGDAGQDRKSTRLNSSHGSISYAVFCLKNKKLNRLTSRETYAHDTLSHKRHLPAV